jgi:hypothetical protein
MVEAYKRAYRHPKYKTSYRIKNWPEYEKSLRNRGDITVWLRPRLSFRQEKTPCYPTILSVLPLSETFILRRSGVKDGPSGNVSLDTICRVTRKTHSFVTRESLVDG